MHKLLIVIIALFFIGCAVEQPYQNQLPTHSKVMILVPVGSLSQDAKDAFAPGMTDQQTVQVLLDGQLYQPGIDVFSHQSTGRTSLLDAHALFYQANKAGSRSDILANWAPQDQETMNGFLNDFLDRNTNRFQDITSYDIIGTIQQGAYTLLLVDVMFSDGTNWKTAHTYTQIGNEWFVTNDLAADAVLNFVTQSLNTNAQLIPSN